jgi:hypothetical protein
MRAQLPNFLRADTLPTEIPVVGIKRRRSSTKLSLSLIESDAL